LHIALLIGIVVLTGTHLGARALRVDTIVLQISVRHERHLLPVGLLKIGSVFLSKSQFKEPGLGRCVTHVQTKDSEPARHVLEDLQIDVVWPRDACTTTGSSAACRRPSIACRAGRMTLEEGCDDR
jgi:hypothetical protein